MYIKYEVKNRRGRHDHCYSVFFVDSVAVNLQKKKIFILIYLCVCIYTFFNLKWLVENYPLCMGVANKYALRFSKLKGNHYPVSALSWTSVFCGKDKTWVLQTNKMVIFNCTRDVLLEIKLKCFNRNNFFEYFNCL